MLIYVNLYFTEKHGDVKLINMNMYFLLMLCSESVHTWEAEKLLHRVEN